jgi:thiamine-phosphate pyrophosphorylase
MSDSGLTPGAMRALEAAGGIAWAAGAVEVEPTHLLWALTLDETRASDLLRRSGIDADKLATAFPQPAKLAATLEPPVPIPLSPALSDVLIEARTLVARMGAEPHVGTEHLLSALAMVDEAIGRFFDQFGIGPNRIAQQVAEDAGIPTEPLPVEFKIHWQVPTETDHTDTLRVLDAAANRAREGLRVVEDFVRFSLDDAHLSRLLKELRHELTERLQTLDRLALAASRDTPGDVGTRIKTPREQRRRLPQDIVQANCRRVEEALRTLEEFSKLVASRLADPQLPAHLEQLRYRLYTIEKALAATLASRDRLASRDLYLLVTDSLCHHGIGPAVREALAAGVGIVQLREKDASDRRIIELGGRVREWTHQAGALFIMNDRADVAVLTDADGVHVGQNELSVREARRIVGAQRLIGVSTHTIEQARQAVLDGADYLGVGPVFTSGTKAFEQLAGLDFVRQVAAEITLPWFAIGGISLDNIEGVKSAGARRVAVSGAICSSATPGRTAEEILELLRD